MNKDITYGMENVSTQHVDYHVYLYPHPARPLCLGDSILGCQRGGCEKEAGRVLPRRHWQAEQHREEAQTKAKA
jgi:hypothetical protein